MINHTLHWPFIPVYAAISVFQVGSSVFLTHSCYKTLHTHKYSSKSEYNRNEADQIDAQVDIVLAESHQPRKKTSKVK